MPRRPAVPGLDRRLQIMDAALDVFAEQTFDRAATKEIADRAGVTQGLIYFYFPNKEELFLEAYDYFARKIIDTLDFTADIQSDAPPDVGLRRIIGRVLEVLDAPPGNNLLRITMQAMSSANDTTRDAQGLLCQKPQFQKIGELARHIGGGVQAYLSIQRERGAIRPIDSELVAQMMTSVLVSTLVRRTRGDEAVTRYSRATLCDTLVATFLHGVLVMPDA